MNILPAADFDFMAWIDVETTGLFKDGVPPLLLEFGMVITLPNLVEVERFSAVIRPNLNPYMAMEAFPEVREMHTKNGLLDEVENGSELSKVYREACNVVQRYQAGGRKVIWAGSSPGALDKAVLENYMPQFTKLFGHRTFDLSTLEVFMQTYAGEIRTAHEPTHRALQDCLDEIKRARYFTSAVRTLFHRVLDKHGSECSVCSRYPAKYLPGTGHFCLSCHLDRIPLGTSKKEVQEIRQQWFLADWH